MQSRQYSYSAASTSWKKQQDKIKNMYIQCLYNGITHIYIYNGVFDIYKQIDV